ncbi:MAG: hypothetical protein IIB81_03280 [Nanoarchaeota archaeon]|nr:hypothetical protein [Nanoarchaeota archaeon]
MEKGTFTQIDDMTDPYFWSRRFTSENINMLTNLIKDNRRDKYNIVTFFFGIVMTGLLSFFATRENWVLSILFLDILLALVIWQTRSHNKRDKELIPIWEKQIEFGKSIGMNLGK